MMGREKHILVNRNSLLQRYYNMKKKGLTPVIATILLILLAVTAVIAIASFIIPWMNQDLDEGKTCFDLKGKIEVIDDDSYSCYDEALGEAKVWIRVNDLGEIKLNGILVSLIGSGQSKEFRVIEDSLIPGVSMLVGGVDLKVPNKQDISMTYVFSDLSFKVERVIVAGILENDKICGDENFPIPKCK